MIIAGIERTSLVDWPGNICSVVFIAGCNFRCPFCHNPELVEKEEIEKIEAMTENELITSIYERKRFIDGVCITGGEPLMSPGVIALMRKLKEKGFALKLDTNGSVPSLLKKVIDEGLVSYVAIDIKAQKERYAELSGSKIDVKLIEESIKILKSSGIDYELRTTVVRGLLDKEDIVSIGKWLSGCKAYYLQQFVSSGKMLDKSLEGTKAHPPEDLKEMLEAVKDCFEKTGVRGI